MLGKSISYFVKILSERRILFFIIFSVILGLLVQGVRRIKIEEDIYSIFPDNKTFQDFSELLKNNNLNQQVVFTLRVDDDEEQALRRIQEISVELERDFSTELKEIQVTRNVNELDLIQYLQKVSLLQFNDSDYVAFSKKINSDSLDLILSKTFARLNDVSGFFIRSLLLQDPIGLSNEKLALLNPMSDSSLFVLKDGLLYTKDEKTILFFATLDINLKESLKISEFNAKIVGYRNLKNKEFKSDQFDYFGTFQIAAENAAQVKKDTALTSLVSLALILLILVYYFRSVVVPFYFILPALFGILCGGGIVGWFHPQISAISLATASVLLGIVLDYSFHFFTHFQQSTNILQTVKSIATPMIIGSFTTVAALASLIFTNSVVLQDFGLIALCVLSGSVIFTLVILPVFILIFNISLPTAKSFHEGIKLRKGFLRFSLAISTLVTFFLLVNNLNFSFDSDLNNLSFHSEELKKKEEFYTGINPSSERKLYVMATSHDMALVKEINSEIFNITSHNRERLGITEMISTAPYLFSNRQITEANKKWKNFWVDKKDTVIYKLRFQSRLNGFSQSAFTSFENWINDASVDSTKGVGLLNELGLNKLIYSDDRGTSLITSVVIKKDNVEAYKKLLSGKEGVHILDMADLISTMLATVQFDLNYLLFFAGIVVFASLIIVYGRIELALFSFFPMVIGWIWTIGIANFFDIKFNFVNIVIATFIFGLGDDFSIFTTDGLIQKYRTGSDHSRSFRSAIILSGVTTIVGTGALFFAQHPAIHSIAAISVIGISSVLFITVIIQPLIFEFLLMRRIKAGRPPLTLINFLFSSALFLYFIIGCILLNVLLIFIIFPLPVSKRRKRNLLNFIVSKLAKSTIYAGFHVKKQIVDPHKLNFNRPSIIVANHASFLDILVIIMLHPKVVIMVKSWVYNSPFFGLFIRYAGYPFIEEGIETNLESIQELINDGYSIVIFPEGTRSVNGEIQRFHKGAFFIAKELNLEVQPLLLIGTHEVNPKNDISIISSSLIVLPLERVSAQEDESYSDFTKRVQFLMRNAYFENKLRYAKSDFWQTLVLRNYILKGPVLEWYVRTKWALEKLNYEFYDELISNRIRIFDVGCGYGYLSYYLHYRNPSRCITGIDYDSEKIKTAQNGIARNKNLVFSDSDIRSANIEAADVIILNDVLHYLKKEEQYELLERMISKLGDDGLMLIRDGIVELKKDHKATLFSELLSTRIFKFNKVSNDLCFISELELNIFIEKHELTIEKTIQKKATSNVLFVIRKKQNEHK